MKLFSDEWINLLKDLWNQTEDVSGKLAEIKFCSTITCGFKNEELPRCVFVVKDGIAVSAGLYQGEKADWDMRADQANWDKWTTKPLGMTSMGMAVATGKLQFKTGDFKAMIKNPSMAGPFVKSFSLMTQI
jgi:putative sterol carrier protein